MLKYFVFSVNKGVVLLFTFLIVALAVSCGPAAEVEDAPSPTAIPESPREVLDTLGAEDILLESFRITETSVAYAIHSMLGPTTKTTVTVREFQKPDRRRIVIYGVDYRSDPDGDGVYDNIISDGSEDCASEHVTIGSTIYERCGEEPWSINEAQEAYAVPYSNLADLVDPVRELGDLQSPELSEIGGRPMLVFTGAAPDKPPDVYEYSRTVWIDAETAFVRRVVDEIWLEESPPDSTPDMVDTVDYSDYNTVVIEQPMG